MKQSTVETLKSVWRESRPYLSAIFVVGFLVCVYKVHPFLLGAWICYRYSQTLQGDSK